MVRTWAVCGVIAIAGVAAASEPLRIADVQALPRGEVAGKQVVIRGGVVTWIKMPDRSRLTIQDGDRGMWITTTKPWPKSPAVWRGSEETLAALAVGDELEIEGILDLGGFAPKLLASDPTRCQSMTNGFSPAPTNAAASTSRASSRAFASRSSNGKTGC
ncbi:MAG: hypothetical protein EBZ74_10300 [Planctomycetia bacterium]|nr:hypothetical protein [Planctomycetia bacterium]